MGTLCMDHLSAYRDFSAPPTMYATQEYFELFLLYWLTEDELEEALLYYPEYAECTNKEEYKKVRMAAANIRLSRMFLNDKVHFYKDTKEYYIIRYNRLNKDLRKPLDKPIVSGQPRRFTKAYIPSMALLQCFRYAIPKYKLDSIQKLEEYVDNNFSRAIILLIVYKELLLHGECLDVTYWVGTGRYEQADADFIRNHPGSEDWLYYTEVEDFGIPKEDLGILF